MSLFGAKTWVELSRAAMEQNIAALRSFLQPESVFCAVIKANAYGHGEKEIAAIVRECGVMHFAVDSIDEAITLRETVPDAHIFILGFTVFERLQDVVAIDAIQTITDVAEIKELARAGSEANVQARVSIKIETGLQRQGVLPRKIRDLCDAILATNSAVRLESVSSHFAQAEEPNDPMNAWQMEHFRSAIARIESLGLCPHYRHIACSAAAMANKESQYTLSRFGIALYGLWSSHALKRHVVLGRQNIELSPVLAWKTRIAQVKDVPTGSAIGYGGTHVTNRPIRLAVLPVGYADGFDRGLSNKGHVLIHGRKCPVLGIVCMNMCMVDVSAVPNAAQNTEVTLLGRDGMHAISADEIATILGTINYEVVTRISARLPRVIC